MKNLLKAEFFKLKKLIAYKALLVIYLVIEAAVQMNNISNSVIYPEYNPAYTGAEWLLNLHQTLLLYSVAVFLFTVFYVKGDCTGHTFHSCLLCGVPRKSICKSLKTVGLMGADADSTKTKNFSLGMKQRLGIAMALLGEPQLLFLMSPSMGLILWESAISIS